jgi:hypothetical protein
MREYPISFTAPMIRAIQAGVKSQTRRTINHLSGYDTPIEICENRLVIDSWIMGELHVKSSIRIPYGQVGDHLRVKELWAVLKDYDDLPGSKIPEDGKKKIWYPATGPRPEWAGRIRSHLFMPRWASRIYLEVKNIRVERVQRITREDAFAEGVFAKPYSLSFDQLIPELKELYLDMALRLYPSVWDKINARRGYPWKNNPWVFIVCFEAIH